MWKWFKTKPKEKLIRFQVNVQEDITTYELLNAPGLILHKSARILAITAEDWEQLVTKCPNISRHFILMESGTDE